MARKKEKAEGELDSTGTSSKVLYPHDRPERDVEIQEATDRPFEAVPIDTEHGLGPMGKRLVGKAKAIVGRARMRKRGELPVFFKQQKPGKR
ncbi:MAG: hypothetical protein HYV24_10380 [Deltaproteobacteria bacterium]|nr:hypothetical protein [Deltaproteobacteria bacterium]